MDIDIIKESVIEYIEGIYALGINYLKSNKNIKLKNMLEELELIEDSIRNCKDKDILDNYKNMLNHLVNRIEGIINE